MRGVDGRVAGTRPRRWRPGTHVHVDKEGRSFKPEFTTYDGTTVALARVAAAQIRPLARNEIHHARRIDLGGQ